MARFFPSALLLAFTLLGSCESSSSSEVRPSPEINRTGEKTIVMDVGDLALLPDHAFATLADSSEATVTVRDSSGGDIAFTVKLEKALGDGEPLALNLVSYGLVTTTVKCVMNSNGELASVGAIRRDTMALTILRRLDGTTYPKTADGAIQAYADALLRDQTLFQPYPETFPVGLDTAKVRVEALRRAVKLSLPLARIAEEWGLPLSYQAARDQILALDPRIPSSDSAILFPPPVRIQQPISSSGGLKESGDSVRIAGVIASDTTLVSVRVEVLDDKGAVVTDKFTVVSIQPKGVESWDLAKDGKVVIQSVSAPSGTYTVRIVGRDVQDHTIEAEVEITVVKPVVVDRQGPGIKLVSPSADTTVEHAVATLDVVVSATDSSGVDSVTIRGGAATKKNDGNWRRSVSLDTAGSTTMIEIFAFDHAGNWSRTTVQVTRKPVPVAVGPSIRIVAPDSTEELVLPFDSSSLRVKWTLSNAGEIADNSVTITGGSPNLVSDSTWQAVVPVPATGKPFTIAITARTKAGKTIAESFTATRLRDTLPPRIERRAGSRTVPADSSTAMASWSVTDNHRIDIVLVGGTSVKLDSVGSYSARVEMIDSVNRVEIVAIDSFGNRSRDTIVLVRGARIGPPEDSKPTLTLLSPDSKSGQILPFDSGSALVRWKILDVFGIPSDSVWIDGRIAKKEADSIWSLRVALSPTGNPRTIPVTVVNIKGTKAHDTVSIARRRDTIPPAAKPLAANVANVPFSTVSALVGWAVTDNHKVASVTINGKVVSTDDGNEYAATIPLSTGDNKVVLVARDSMGNTTRDSVTVTCEHDKIPPVATFKGASKSITLEHDVASVDVQWTVTDNHKVASVTIDGKPVAPTAGIYTATIAITQFGETKVRLLAKDSMGNSTSDSVTITRALGASPVLIFSHSEAAYDTAIHVSIRSSVPDAEITYTLDGTEPSATNGLAYTPGATILVDQSRTLKAIATASGHEPGSVLVRAYTLKVATPAFSLPAGTTADSMFTVKLLSTTPGVTFHYTKDGSNPVVGVSPIATGEILVDSIRTYKVIATKAGWSSSEAISAKFLANIPISVFVGMGGSKVIRADGSLWSTGLAEGLADGSVVDRTEFAKVRSGVRAVDAGLILTTSGDLFSYGGRYGSTASEITLLGSGFSGISAGVEPSAMVLNPNGDMYGLGANGAGQLCTGDSSEAQSLILVSRGVKDVDVSCTSYRGTAFCRTIYVTKSGSAFGCGTNIGVVQPNAAVPTQIPGTGYASVSLFADYITASPILRASLVSSTGILTDLTSSTTGPVWTEVRTGTVKAIPAGRALYSLEKYGWLYSLESGADPSTGWTQVSNQIKDFASDGTTNLYIKTDGTLWASGTNAGKYGDGTKESSTTMKRIRLPN